MGRTKRTRVQLTIEPELGDLFEGTGPGNKLFPVRPHRRTTHGDGPGSRKEPELMKMASKLKGSGQQRVKAHLEATSRSWKKRWHKA